MGVSAETEPATFLFVGGHLCLDFVNTEVMRAGRRVDLIASWKKFLDWAAAANPVSEPVRDAAEPSSPLMSLSPDQAADALKAALMLRQAVRSIAEALAMGSAAPPEAVASVNRVLEQNPGYQRIMPSAEAPGRYRRQMIAPMTEPVHLLGLVAQDAADLLCHGDPHLVRRCENPNCILLFYDNTRNHARRWCSMAGCGNRAKAAAHYRRRVQPSNTAGKQEQSP